MALKRCKDGANLAIVDYSVISGHPVERKIAGMSCDCTTLPPIGCLGPAGARYVNIENCFDDIDTALIKRSLQAPCLQTTNAVCSHDFPRAMHCAAIVEMSTEVTDRGLGPMCENDYNSERYSTLSVTEITSYIIFMIMPTSCPQDGTIEWPHKTKLLL